MSDETIKSQLTSEAIDAGFSVVRFTHPDSIPQASKGLQEYLDLGHHGEMEWMATTQERRGNPQNLWPEAKSVIMLGMNYGPDSNPLDDLARTHIGTISVYARSKDYHDVIKKKLKKLASWLHQKTSSDVKVFVDTAPVMEKPLAASSGMGWQGKHTNLVSREYGSWLFLSSIFTTYSFDKDDAISDHCGSCSRCVDICPTNAFPEPYKLDARKCLAYLTIEHKGHIQEIYRKPLANRVFGCDDCLAVCPWNKYARKVSESKLFAREETSNLRLEDLLTLTNEQFRLQFAGTPVKRTGRDRFIRNVLIACGNSGDVELLPNITKLLDDPSELVRAMAVWALRQLTSRQVFEELKQKYYVQESDGYVRTEWCSADQEGE